MSVNLIVAVTDKDWFDCLRQESNLAEANFWAPSASTFKALQPGELFLFKLHAPINMIVGGGIFAHATTMPLSLAWDAFGRGNGAYSKQEMRHRIARYRSASPTDREDFTIGCRILTQPFFLPESQWLSPPPSWSPQIVTFKRYSTAEAEGAALWQALGTFTDSGVGTGVSERRYGDPVLVKPRLGQGAFRLLVRDAYSRQCAVTKERTLPALEAAHIRPYKEGGSHDASNGLLLRRDIHSLFDQGYVTVTPGHLFEVSSKIREEFENGRHYYELQGTPIRTPADPRLLPDPDALVWHNENIFRG